MPGDLELALRVRTDMQEALQGIGALNRSLGDTARRGDEAGAALAGATGSTQAFTLALGTLGRGSESTLDQARAAAESAFGAMESALTRFITTGETSFSGFVDSVIADLTRIATRRFIVQPLANALFSAFGSEGGAGAGADAFRRLQAGVGHAGGTVGAAGGVSRRVPAAIFAGAKRYHLAVSPASGRTAASRGSGRTRCRSSRRPARLFCRAPLAAPSVDITFENRGTPQREVSREVRLDPRGLIVTVVTEDLDGGGPASQAIARRFGLRDAVA